MTRAEIIAAAQDRLPKLGIGQSATFDLPLEQPERRVLYQAIQNIAGHQFGSRRYSIRSEDDGRLIVTHTKQQPYPAGRRQLAASLRSAKS